MTLSKLSNERRRRKRNPVNTTVAIEMMLRRIDVASFNETARATFLSLLTGGFVSLPWFSIEARYLAVAHYVRPIRERAAPRANAYQFGLPPGWGFLLNSS